MKNFGINLVGLPKYLTGSFKNGILLLYNGPQYHEILELMKKENPEAYNRLLVAIAKRQNPNSEVVIYTDANGNLRNATNTGAGFISGTDPIGAEVVAGAVLSKPLELAGRAALYGLGRAGNNWARARLISRKMNDVVDEGLQYFGKVKYYGPTMGKTTAAKTNHDLVDFDDFTREAKNELAKKLNISPRVLQSDPKYALAYLEMLEKLLDSWRRNPLNTDKTLVISKKGLADKNIYNNEPSIPDRLTFVQRLRNRGEIDDANSNDWYNMLLKQNPNLRIDNRFVSEIEYNPHYIESQSSKLPYLKKGSGIHIKKKNRGKFTEYCGGEVTNECIQKAKKSNNPKLRKRAIFALNSRRWKHEEGAKIHKPDGHRSILDNGWIPTKRLKKGTYGLVKRNNS